MGPRDPERPDQGRKLTAVRPPLYDKFFVQPVTAVVTSPNLSAHKPAGNCAPRYNHRPQMPGSCPCGALVQPDYPDVNGCEADRCHRDLLGSICAQLIIGYATAQAGSDSIYIDRAFCDFRLSPPSHTKPEIALAPLRTMSALGPDCVKTRMLRFAGAGGSEVEPMLGSLLLVRRRRECS
jgi:hypothetical protein